MTRFPSGARDRGGRAGGVMVRVGVVRVGRTGGTASDGRVYPRAALRGEGSLEQVSEFRHQNHRFLMPPFSVLLSQIHSLHSAIKNPSLWQML
ncbi:hypothetical protein GCM10008960_33460 [Deinococcus sedimenti]|uniref:Uncharacterized protein n=1 Tax=Deinococcus sedimenti TaxID=1867090 RepID=A0ABQ2SA83_9DEIO|nr:hypothetical protein GCM10008960_33460 [Deinococcus sedimenti]